MRSSSGLGFTGRLSLGGCNLGDAAVSKPANAAISPAGSESVVARFGGPTGLVQASCEASTGPPRHQASDASPWLEWLLEQRGRAFPSGESTKISGSNIQPPRGSAMTAYGGS